MGREVVITEKMDGENTTMYRDHIHARSIDSGYHPSRTWVKSLHGKIAHEIPEGMRIVGENLQAQHSIAYYDLPSFFLVHSIWQDSTCQPWRETTEWCELLGLEHVPVLDLTDWTEARQEAYTWGDWNPFALGGTFSDEMEGYVVRCTDPFPIWDFQKNVAKWVRKDHVGPENHNWMHRRFVPNVLQSAS